MGRKEDSIFLHHDEYIGLNNNGETKRVNRGGVKIHGWDTMYIGALATSLRVFADTLNDRSPNTDTHRRIIHLPFHSTGIPIRRDIA